MEFHTYLGERDGVVVLFTDENEGTVVRSTDPDFKFGRHGYFNESEFNPLPPDTTVVLG